MQLKGLEIIGCCLLALCISSCESNPVPDPNPPLELPVTHGVFILNQGGNEQNNATLSFYDPGSKTLTPVAFPSAVSPNSSEPLGDLGQDMLLYGNKLYIVVSNSSYIRVLDLGKREHLGKIILADDAGKPRAPRYLTATGGKVYVTCSTDGTVARIDTASLKVDGSVKVGSYPEGIAVCSHNNKLYVANSGFGTGKTVSVIDIATFKEDQKIEVGINPDIVKAYNNYVYLSYQGNWEDIPGGFQRIDAHNNTVTTLGSYPKADFSLEDGTIYYYDVTYNPVDWSVELSFGKFNTSDESYPHPSPLITDATQLVSPFGIGIQPATKNVYITDAIDYVNPGKVYVFNPAGKKIDEFTAGISPCKVVFY
ncbi:hypothetical protein FACS1894182_00700 [Bacteroidia bacterium]|nr:hypothetical protein FACS1894182_00700 [Bacteroidia bacterium]